MPQIRILEYTIFRAFFCDFHHFPLHFPHHFPHYVPQQYFLHFWQLFCTIKRVQKSKKDNSQKKDENDENLWPNEAPKLRSFEAFVIVIEISSFGFENSTLVNFYGMEFCTFVENISLHEQTRCLLSLSMLNM